METFANTIAQVDSSNAAIVCLTISGLILLYAKYKVKSLKKPIVHETVNHVAVYGEENQEKCMNFIYFCGFMNLSH